MRGEGDVPRRDQRQPLGARRRIRLDDLCGVLLRGDGRRGDESRDAGEGETHCRLGERVRRDERALLYQPIGAAQGRRMYGGSKASWSDARVETRRTSRGFLRGAGYVAPP